MLRQLLNSAQNRTVTVAVFSLIFHLLYAFYNGVLGLLSHSLWFTVSCVYYLLLCAMRFVALLYKGTYTARAVGVLIVVLSPVLGGILCISIQQETAVAYGEITMITIATYTFTKLILAIIEAMRKRTAISPTLYAIQHIRYAEIAVAVFTMQQSMLLSFGEMPAETRLIFNLCTGIATVVFVLCIGIHLMRKKEKNDV